MGKIILKFILKRVENSYFGFSKMNLDHSSIALDKLILLSSPAQELWENLCNLHFLDRNQSISSFSLKKYSSKLNEKFQTKINFIPEENRHSNDLFVNNFDKISHKHFLIDIISSRNCIDYTTCTYYCKESSLVYRSRPKPFFIVSAARL